MSNKTKLYKEFIELFDKGQEAVQEGKKEQAKQHFTNASNILLELAKESTGYEKKQFLLKSEMLLNYGIDLHEEDSSEDEPKKKGILFNDIAGLENVKKAIRQSIINFIDHKEIYNAFNRRKGSAILLYGAPGTGKTMIARAVANEVTGKFYDIKCSDIVDKWMGESERKIKELFEDARNQPVSILFFDEFDALSNDDENSAPAMRRIVSELLSQMDGTNRSENLMLIIASTNVPWKIRSAFKRPGRFSDIIYVPLPDEKSRLKILQMNLQNSPKEELNYKDMVAFTKGFNSADVVEFCEKLKTNAITRSIQLKQELPDTATMQDYLSPINSIDVKTAMKTAVSSVSYDDLEELAAYRKSIGKEQVYD